MPIRSPETARESYGAQAMGPLPAPITALRRATRLLQAASGDWRAAGPSDGSDPLHWPVAVKAALAHLRFALDLFERTAMQCTTCAGEPLSDPCTSCNGTGRDPRAEDALAGIDWWNALTPIDRSEWMQRARSNAAVNAWEAFKSQR